MFTLIFAIIVGLGIAYFATQNTLFVPIILSNNTPIAEVPLYVIIIGSLFVGIAIAAIISAVESLSSSVTIYGKERMIEKLQNKMHDMEVELARLKGEKEERRVVVEEHTHTPGVLDNLRHKLHFR
ncbi:DUF1049 domain-containing protein [Candidatus Gottesmanbacteria bacterium]|nr:DUF1049 domain-containing protein [Candidatus Gottesmanbacteria bacterium]